MNRLEALLREKQTDRLFFIQSLPAVLALLAQGLYQMVDTIYIGRMVGTDGLTACAWTYPFVLVMTGFGSLISVGSASLYSRLLGAGRLREARGVFSMILPLSFPFFLLCLITGFFIAPALLRTPGESAAYGMATDYLRIDSMGSLFMISALAFTALLRGGGFVRAALALQSAGTILNIILDPFFIRPFGMAGAAWATLISKAFLFLLCLLFFIREKKGTGVPPWRKTGEIFSVGLSALALETMTIIQMAYFFGMIKRHGTDADYAILAGVMRILNFSLIPLWGISQGYQPLAGYCFSAGQERSHARLFRSFTSGATLWMVFAQGLLLLFGRNILGLFILDVAILSRGVPVLHWMTGLFFLYGVMILLLTDFQAVGKAVPTGFLVLSRMLIFFVPASLILTRLFGIAGLWAAVPLSDALTLSCAVVMKRRMRYTLQGAGDIST